jgi:hypothetical protein
MRATHEPTVEEYVNRGKPYLHPCDWPEGCKEYAYVELMRTHPSQTRIYRCLLHLPKYRSDYASAFQYGIPEVHARYPGIRFESFTIRHPSGASIEARDHDSVFTYGDVTSISKNPVEISTADLLTRFELEDWDWHIVVPGVIYGWSSEKRFESGDPKLYTRCQACGESVEGQKAAWDYGQYHIGGCYDTLFADCLSCGVHRKDCQTNRSIHSHMFAKYAAQLCGDCLHARWKDRNFRAFAEDIFAEA